jgi:hypothetical protein
MALNEHDMSSPERDARVDRLYAHVGREEPPAELDAAIRAAARQAVGARPRALGARLRRWGVPISIAAVVVVSVSLVTLMREEGAGRLEESYAPAPAEPKASAPAPPAGAPVEAQDRAEPAGQAQVTAPQAPPAPAERAGAASSADDSPRPGRLVAPSSAGLKPAEEGAREAPRARAEVDGGAARQALPEREALGKKKTEARAADAPAPPAAALRSAPIRADQEPLTASTGEKSERPLTSDQVALLKTLEKAAPESWLETIERLRREGRHADADALLVEFRRRFPAHPLTRQESERAR